MYVTVVIQNWSVICVKPYLVYQACAKSTRHGYDTLFIDAVRVRQIAAMQEHSA